MKKILFLIDIKSRDLPSSSLIGYELKKRGYKVYFCALHQEDQIINHIKPDCIILNKPIYFDEKILKWKLQGIRIISFDTEGNPQDKVCLYKIKKFPDLLIFWNKNEKLKYDKYFKFKNSYLTGPVPKTFVGGGIRLDFFHKKFKSIFSSTNINKNKKIITIASSTQEAHLNEKDINRIYKVRSNTMEETVDYFKIVKMMKSNLSINIQLLQYLNKQKDYNIHFKPHPNENIKEWKKIIKSRKLNRIKIFNKNINYLLSNSDLHIANSVCTTTFEAKLKGIKTIEIQSKFCSSLWKKDHLKLPDFIIKSKNDFKKIKHIKKKKNSFFKSYIYKYYSFFDGKNYIRYADIVDNYLLKKENLDNKYIFFIILNYLYLNFKRHLSDKIFIFFSLQNNKNKSKSKSKYDLRGRLDHRIKINDEIKYYKIFRRLKL